MRVATLCLSMYTTTLAINLLPSPQPAWIHPQAFEPQEEDAVLRVALLSELQEALDAAFPAPSTILVQPYGSYVSGWWVT